MKSSFLSGIAVLVLLGGCAEERSEFEGKWADTKHDNRRIEIVRSEAGLILRIAVTDSVTGRAETISVPGTVHNGSFQAGYDDAGRYISHFMTYDGASGHLKAGTDEYKRVD